MVANGLTPVPSARPPSRIRDLNDEINKLMREKGHWEKRIVELGGPDYAKTAPKVTDSSGQEIAEASGRGAGYRCGPQLLAGPSAFAVPVSLSKGAVTAAHKVLCFNVTLRRGRCSCPPAPAAAPPPSCPPLRAQDQEHPHKFLLTRRNRAPPVHGSIGPRGLFIFLLRYFGAAKNLPGVKELFEKEAPKAARRSRYQMHRAIDPDYYGFRDEEDGVLERVEAEAERMLRAQAVLEWEQKEAERQRALGTSGRGGAGAAAGTSGAAGGGGGGGEDAPRFVAYVPLPDDKAIEQRVLERKKAELLAKYASDGLLREQEEARAMLNKK